MKKYLIPLCGMTAILAISGCAYPDGAYQGGVYQQRTVQYDGYYDGYYGPYTNGYWGGDGFFYYQSNDRQYRRDDARHFRRDQFHGSYGIHGGDRQHNDQRNRYEKHDYGHNSNSQRYRHDSRDHDRNYGGY